MDSRDDIEQRYPIKAPGWLAIDQALAAAYPGHVPHQYASETGYDLESRAPLPAISVCEATGPDHWHFVTYGLSELFEKSSPKADISGFGFELTFRVPRGPEETEPPGWVLSLLQGVGHYVLSGHAELDTGHLIDLGGPLRPAAAGPTELIGVVAVPDSTLGKLDTAHGSVLFLQLYGLTQAELEAMADWDLQRKVGLVEEVSTHGITDPTRAPLADSPRTAPAYRRYALKIMI